MFLLPYGVMVAHRSLKPDASEAKSLGSNPSGATNIFVFQQLRIDSFESMTFLIVI